MEEHFSGLKLQISIYRQALAGAVPGFSISARIARYCFDRRKLPVDHLLQHLAANWIASQRQWLRKIAGGFAHVSDNGAFGNRWRWETLANLYQFAARRPVTSDRR